jgi:hypothetical protein
MAHDHGSEYQIRAIREDGTEAMSAWIERGDLERTMAVFRAPQVKAYWLRERNVTVVDGSICRENEAAISEYPFAYSSASRSSQPHDSDYLRPKGVDLAAIRTRYAGR